MPDMTRPRASCVHIRQCTPACVTTITYALGIDIYIRQIPTGHGISNIYHLSVLTKSYVGPFGSLYKRPSEL